jgi:hypothetical protein
MGISDDVRYRGVLKYVPSREAQIAQLHPVMRFQIPDLPHLLRWQPLAHLSE